VKKKKKKIIETENNTNEVTIDYIANDDFDEVYDDYMIERCEVISIKDNSLIINFKGHGINIRTSGVIDRDLIQSFIDVKYKSDIGLIDFEYHPIF
jgi:hypothetical protein